MWFQRDYFRIRLPWSFTRLCETQHESGFCFCFFVYIILVSSSSEALPIWLLSIVLLEKCLVLNHLARFLDQWSLNFVGLTPFGLMFPRATLWVNISAFIELPSSITLLWLHRYKIACTQREILADSVRHLADCSTTFICAFPNGIMLAQSFMLKKEIMFKVIFFPSWLN